MDHIDYQKGLIKKIKKEIGKSDAQYHETLLKEFKKDVNRFIESFPDFPEDIKKKMISNTLEINLRKFEEDLKEPYKGVSKDIARPDYTKTLEEAENYIKEKLK